MFLDTVICEGLDYAMMSALASCQLYTTTSTTTDPSQVNIMYIRLRGAITVEQLPSTL